MNLVWARTQVSPQTENLTEYQLEGLWHVIVLNDPVNLMSYVVMVFRKVLGFDETKARKHMMEVQNRVARWCGAGCEKKPKPMPILCNNGI
jgi:ATP-dependent Clp protease adaptor protein ClpS